MGERPKYTAAPSFRAAFIATQLFAWVALASMWAWVLGKRYLGGLGSRGDAYFNWHPFLNTTAFFLLSQGVIAYRTWPGSLGYQKRVHAAFNTSALLLLLVGATIVIKHTTSHGFDHFVTVHSWLALASAVLLLTQWTLGAVAFLTDALSPDSQRAALPWHKYLGGLTYTMLFATILLGLFNRQRFLPDVDGPYAGAKLFANALALLWGGVAATVMFWLSPATASAPRHMPKGAPVFEGGPLRRDEQRAAAHA